jgi:hypothetical protein
MTLYAVEYQNRVWITLAADKVGVLLVRVEAGFTGGARDCKQATQAMRAILGAEPREPVDLDALAEWLRRVPDDDGYGYAAAFVAGVPIDARRLRDDVDGLHGPASIAVASIPARDGGITPSLVLIGDDWRYALASLAVSRWPHWKGGA